MTKRFIVNLTFQRFGIYACGEGYITVNFFSRSLLGGRSVFNPKRSFASQIHKIYCIYYCCDSDCLYLLSLSQTWHFSNPKNNYDWKLLALLCKAKKDVFWICRAVHDACARRWELWYFVNTVHIHKADCDVKYFILYLMLVVNPLTAGAAYIRVFIFY